MNVTKNINDRYGLLDITAGPDGDLWSTGFAGEIFQVTTGGAVSHPVSGPVRDAAGHHSR